MKRAERRAIRARGAGLGFLLRSYFIRKTDYVSSQANYVFPSSIFPQGWGLEVRTLASS
jgi:hypothetical protein